MQENKNSSGLYIISLPFLVVCLCPSIYLYLYLPIHLSICLNHKYTVCLVCSLNNQPTYIIYPSIQYPYHLSIYLVSISSIHSSICIHHLFTHSKITLCYLAIHLQSGYCDIFLLCKEYCNNIPSKFVPVCHEANFHHPYILTSSIKLSIHPPILHPIHPPIH